MTIHFRQGKLEAHERQAILEEVYQQAKATARIAVKALIETLLEAVVTLPTSQSHGQNSGQSPDRNTPGSGGDRQVGTRERSSAPHQRTAAHQ